jgi:hypothetical protein
MNRFKSIGVIKNEAVYDDEKLRLFTGVIADMRSRKKWTRLELIDLFNEMLPEFNHKETGKFLDGKM